MKRVKKKNDKLAPGGYSFHEAVDRSLMAFEFFDSNVAEHPAIRNNKRLSKKVDKIEHLMWGLYQTLGKMHLDD